MNLSKNKIKYIQSLKDKKYRLEHGTFVAESNKLVADLLPVMKCQLLVATPDFVENHKELLKNAGELIITSGEEISRASFLKTPQQVIGVFYQPDYHVENIDIKNKLSLALDGIQDPGNFGTIVRLADWYGIEDIFCSKDTVDIYNPKTIQATMGALARVRVHYTELEKLFTDNSDVPV